MTEQLTVAETFIVELATAGLQLHLTSALAYAIDCATREQGWTVQQLVTEALRNNDYDNPGGAITRRFRIIVEDKIAAPKAPRSKTGLPKAHKAGVCCDGYGILYDEDVDPPVQSRCPGVTG